MIYGGVISTAANTTAASPKKTVVTVTEGIVYHLKLYFPPGPSGLLHVQIFDATYQVFPTTLGESFVGDNQRFDFDVLYPKDDQPFQLAVVTWNLDDTYAHEVSVWLAMESADEFKARYLPMMQTNQLVQQLGEQEVIRQTERRKKVEAFVGSIPQESGA